jgi:hypothetical protein
LAQDVPAVGPGTYCFRVRARSDRAPVLQEVWGDYTYLQDGNLDSTAPAGPAFTWTAYPNPADLGAATPCAFGYPCSGDYLEPVTGSTPVRTPLFTWHAMKGANSYFVVIAKDANFSNVIDEAFTRVPVYAPRNSLSTPTTYPDETTTYYWAVLPAAAIDGTDALPLDLPNSAKGSFQKRSTPPTLLEPAAGHVFADQPTFRWSPTLGARRYRLQVAADWTFGDPLDDVLTDATSYSSDTTYPADTVLYWRVRADDENLTGLTWSATGTFRKTLQAPLGSATNPTKGDAIPTWSWNSVPGAVWYDLSVDLPDGTHKVLSGYRTPAMTPVQMYGTGIFRWRVRAEYPADSGLTPGRYSTNYSFTRTIREPSSAHADFSRDHVLLSWDAKAGARGYRVQLSGTPEFSRLVENVATDNTSYAPTLKYFGQFSLNAGALYWRVAAVDEGNNLGDYSAPQLISRVRRMEVGTTGALKRGTRRWLTVNVKDFETSGGVGGALLRLRGAGVVRKARTATYGSARLRLRPTRRGYLVISASRRGYTPASITLRIR